MQVGIVLLTLWLGALPPNWGLPDDDAADTGPDNLPEVLAELRAPRSVPMRVDEAVALALAHNFAIRTAAVQRLVSRFNLYVAKDRFHPHVSVDAQAGKKILRGVPSFLGGDDATLRVAPHAEIVLPTGTFLSADLQQTFEAAPVDGFGPWRTDLVLGINQPLLKDFGTVITQAPLDIAAWQNGLSKLEYRTSLLDQISQVIAAYRNFTQASLLLEIADKAVGRAQEVLSNSQQLVAAGRVARADLVQVESEIATRELNFANAAADYVKFQISLLQLISLLPGAPVAPVRESATTSPSYTVEQAQGLALQCRPEYAAELMRREIATKNRQLAHNNRRWDLSLLAEYKRGGAGTQAGSWLTEVAAGKSQTVFLGVTLQMPVVESLLDGQVVAAEVALTQADIAVERTKQTLELQVDGAIRALRLSHGIFKLSGRARKLAAKNLENEKEKLAVGRSSAFVVLRFVNDLVNAEIAEIRAQIAYLNALTQLHTLTGTLLEAWGLHVED